VRLFENDENARTIFHGPNLVKLFAKGAENAGGHILGQRGDGGSANNGSPHPSADQRGVSYLFHLLVSFAVH
jgi:hypothetical protein